MKLYNKDSKFAKKPYLVIFESIIIFIIFLILLAMVTPNFKKTNIRGRTQKGCASDIRVLTGAVENYNMDKATMMQNLDQNLLLQGHYINSIFDNTYSAIECIVVVNNSTDKTYFKCCSLKKKYPNLIILLILK